MRFSAFLIPAVLCCAAAAQNCDFSGYKAQEGLRAEVSAGVLQVNWKGAGEQQLRASFQVNEGAPVIRELAARKGSG